MSGSVFAWTVLASFAFGPRPNLNLNVACLPARVWNRPPVQVRKLDNMLVALESAGPSKARPFALSNGEEERQRKISTVKRTLRELIADPNSCAHLKIGKVKGLKVDADVPSEASPCSPRAEKNAGSPAGSEGGKGSFASRAGLKECPGSPKATSKGERRSWQAQEGGEATSSDRLAAGMLPMDDEVPLNRRGSGDGCGVTEAASALLRGLPYSRQGNGRSIHDEAIQPASTLASDGAVGTSFLQLLGSSPGSVPSDKDDGVGAGDGQPSSAATSEDHAQEEDREKPPFSLSLGPSKPSALATSRDGFAVRHVNKRGWLSSCMPSSSSSSPDKGPHLASHAQEAAMLSAVKADTPPNEPVDHHQRPCHSGNSPEASPMGSQGESSGGPAREESSGTIGGALELDLISRLEATQNVAGEACVWAQKAGASSGRQGSGDVQSSAPVHGLPSPSVPSSALRDAQSKEKVGGSGRVQDEEEQQQQQAAEAAELLQGSATLAAGGPNLLGLATDALLSQQMLLLGNSQGLRGVLPQLPGTFNASSLLWGAQGPSALSAAQLANPSAFLLGWPGLGLGGGNALSMHADALSLEGQQLALLQRQRQAQLLRNLADSRIQNMRTFPPNLASLGQLFQ